jgi:HD superfamily phosphodiesterase
MKHKRFSKERQIARGTKSSDLDYAMSKVVQRAIKEFGGNNKTINGQQGIEKLKVITETTETKDNHFDIKAFASKIGGLVKQ